MLPNYGSDKSENVLHTIRLSAGQHFNSLQFVLNNKQFVVVNKVLGLEAVIRINL